MRVALVTCWVRFKVESISRYLRTGGLFGQKRSRLISPVTSSMPSHATVKSDREDSKSPSQSEQTITESDL